MYVGSYQLYLPDRILCRILPTLLPNRILSTSLHYVHRMNTKKMNVGNIPSIKLTKPGHTLEESVCCVCDYLSKHCDLVLNIVLLAGTNDLHK